MEQKPKYDFSDSLARIDRVLESSGSEYRKFNQIMDVAILDKVKGAFSNAVVIGLRFSFTEENFSLLAQAKIYDLLMSEELLIMNSSPLYFSHVVEGHTIKGVFQAHQQSDFDDLMDVAGRMLSFVDVLNVKIGREPRLIQAAGAMDSQPLFVTSYGGKNEMLGLVMDQMDVPLRSDVRKLYITGSIKELLKEQYSQFFSKSKYDLFYEGNIENVGMSQWIAKQWKE